VVDSFEPKVFARAISMCVNDSDLRSNLGVNGREFVRKHYNKQRLFLDIENFYIQLIAQKRREYQ
jgi:glycosyltransferase involved in cell wall biosynthesis